MLQWRRQQRWLHQQKSCNIPKNYVSDKDHLVSCSANCKHSPRWLYIGSCGYACGMSLWEDNNPWSCNTPTTIWRTKIIWNYVWRTVSTHVGHTLDRVDTHVECPDKEITIYSHESPQQLFVGQRSFGIVFGVLWALMFAVYWTVRICL